MKMVILDGYTENPGDLSWEAFEKLGELVVYDRSPPDEIAGRIGDASVVLTNKAPITKETLAACPSVKYIGVLATGYNIVDIEAAKEKGVIVTNVPAYGTYSVAQFTLALLLEVCHRVGEHNRAVKAGRWESCEDYCFWDYPLIELYDKTIGLIGLGRIGLAAAKICNALGMKVLAHDKHESAEGKKYATYVGLDELLEKSDVVSLHCPLTAENQQIINKDTIAKMKQSAILINTARGQLVAEQDLADALNAGRIYAAAVDVVSVEPIKGGNPLLNAKNCIMTPHIAWAPKEARQRLMEIAVDNLKSFLAGKASNVVNS